MRFQKSAVLFLVLLIFLECEAFRSEDQETVERSDEDQDQDQDQDQENNQESGVRNQESEDEDQDQENPQDSEVRNQESEDEDQDQDQENTQESEESEEDRSAEINSELKNYEKELDKNSLASNYPQLFHPHKKYKLLSTIHENHPKIIGEGKNWLEKVGRKIEEFLSGRDFDEEDAEEKSKLFHNTSEHLLEILETCLQIYHPMLELGAKKSKLSKFCLEQVAKQRLEEVQEVHNIRKKLLAIRVMCWNRPPLLMDVCSEKELSRDMKKKYRLNYEHFILRTGISEKIRLI
ncbi:unnamed protein product [Caenorhabditis angaria]|uniref:Uncharacterized protein n=1 Tax=Caenorhabditis angaria TaxID=860376 RepID=A0A9P1N3S8_9PELO|nr:unnamed protein product [Caenorhabditis angaria]